MPLSKVLAYQSVGFLAIMALTWLNELIALPSLIFGNTSLLLNYRESALKMLLIFAVWFLVSTSTRRLFARVNYLEGFMRICSWCHHIHYKEEWISLEEFLKKGFDTPTTHGICPVCLAKEKAALARAKEAAARKDAGNRKTEGVKPASTP
ncbi:MAG: hypothetical protein EPO07_16635 [Verrucomicrobia bacterium]|nr:MAG: hypothetical protein EPO07_16635 [Verrucomicrobiota bacterium]